VSEARSPVSGRKTDKKGLVEVRHQACRHYCHIEIISLKRPPGCCARISRRLPTFTTRSEPSSIERSTLASLRPALSQNSAIEYVTRNKGTMRFSLGRRGLASIWRAHVVAPLRIQVPCSCQAHGQSSGGQALEASFDPVSGGGFANSELPYPLARLSLRNGKFNAPVVHDLGFALGALLPLPLPLPVASIRFGAWHRLALPRGVF
jgi:hypothetical protein